MTATPLLLKLNHAAEMLSLSPSKLRQLTKQGEIRCVRLCARLLYDPDVLREYVKTEGAKQYAARASLRR